MILWCSKVKHGGGGSSMVWDGWAYSAETGKLVRVDEMMGRAVDN